MIIFADCTQLKGIYKLTPLIRIAVVLVIIAVTIFQCIPAKGAEPVKIGVLSFRPKPQTRAQWSPLTAALKQAIPNRDFVVEALTYPPMFRQKKHTIKFAALTDDGLPISKAAQKTLMVMVVEAIPNK